MMRTSVASDDAKMPPHTAPVPLWVVFGLAMGPAVALGLARFAYALLLPHMRSDLGWSFAQAGAMNTANGVGYLAGAWLAAALGKRVGDKRVFAIGLVLTACLIGATGLPSDFLALLVLRLAAGFTGALAFVAGAGLASAAAAGASRSRVPMLLGIYFAGAGMGITASALAVPPALDAFGWRGGWFVLGALALLATVFGCIAPGRVPAPGAAVSGPARGGWSARFMACTLLAYGLYGAGYIAYATFIVAFLRGEAHFTDAGVAAFWSILGLAAIVAAFAWGPVLGRLRGGRGTAATIGVAAIGAALPLIWRDAPGAYVSAVLFGGAFLAVIAAVTTFARRSAPSHAWTAAIAALTIAFGLGQCIGPILSGAFADGAHGVRVGLWLSVGVLVVAAILAAFQPE